MIVQRIVNVFNTFRFTALVNSKIKAQSIFFYIPKCERSFAIKFLREEFYKFKIFKIKIILLL